MRPAALLFLLALSTPAAAAPSGFGKTALSNRAERPWKLTLVEGKQPRCGSLQVLDKFTGRTVKILAGSGESLTLAPGCRYLLDFAQGLKYFHYNFILEDAQGGFAEFTATVPYLANPQLVLELQGVHVGSPLDRASSEELTRFVEAALRVERDDLAIVQNAIGLRAAPGSGGAGPGR